MTREELIQKQIDEIMDYFPFEKVHAQMVAENWKWGTTNGTSEVPDIPTIRQAARERLKAAARGGNEGYSSTGGFTARCAGGFDEDDGQAWLRLELVFGHEWCCDGESYGEKLPANPYTYRSSTFTGPDYYEVQAAFRKWDEESHPMLQRTVLTAFEAGVDYGLKYLNK
jgi:hypothetical protein